LLSYFNVNSYINILLHYFVDYVNIDKGDTNVHKRRKRSVPSTSVEPNQHGGLRGCDRMVVGFTTTYAIGAYHH
jgi:hypothetical protein